MTPLNAALVNGTASHAFELDDTGGCDHSGAVVLPAAIAAVEMAKRKVTGREFIDAVVIGYDIARRPLEACGAYEPHNGAGFHSTGTCGTFGAAAVAARIHFDVDHGQKDDDEPTVRVTLKDGRTWEEHVPMPLGALTNPVTDEALLRKFCGVVGMVFDEATTQKLADVLMALESVTDVKHEVVTLLGAMPRRTKRLMPNW